MSDESLHILMIEDDQRLAQLTSRYLASHGVVVSHAANGIEGLAEAIRHPYDAVILDLMLPGCVKSSGMIRAIRACSRPCEGLVMCSCPTRRTREPPSGG